jgi:hypothetical protein
LLQLDSRRLNILRNAFFRFLEGGLSGGSRGGDGGLAFVEGAPAASTRAPSARLWRSESTRSMGLKKLQRRNK